MSQAGNLKDLLLMVSKQEGNEETWERFLCVLRPHQLKYALKNENRYNVATCINFDSKQHDYSG